VVNCHENDSIIHKNSIHTFIYVKCDIVESCVSSLMLQTRYPKNTTKFN